MKKVGFLSAFLEKHQVAIRYGTRGFFAAVGIWVASLVVVPVWKEFKTSFAYRDFQKYGVLGTYHHRFFKGLTRWKDLELLDRENKELNTRVALLERDIELERARNSEAEMRQITEDLASRIKDEAGSELARVLSSISYTVPTHLLPHQQYALALGYFRKQEYEQSAVIFNHLLNLQDDTSYQRGEVQMLAAICWYHLKNFKLARHYLRSVTKGGNPRTALYRTAVLWDAILVKAEGKSQEAQRRLTAAVAQFPHSLEASWVNTKLRTPAQEKEHSPKPGKDVHHDH